MKVPQEKMSDFGETLPPNNVEHYASENVLKKVFHSQFDEKIYGGTATVCLQALLLDLGHFVHSL